jgi:hypothetical protein
VGKVGDEGRVGWIAYVYVWEVYPSTTNLIFQDFDERERGRALQMDGYPVLEFLRARPNSRFSGKSDTHTFTCTHNYGFGPSDHMQTISIFKINRERNPRKHNETSGWL